MEKFNVILVAIIILSSCGPRLVNSDLVLMREEIQAELDYKQEIVNSVLNYLDSVSYTLDLNNEFDRKQYQRLYEYEMNRIKPIQKDIEKLEDQIFQINMRIYGH